MSSTKKYKCLYCDTRLDKISLIKHIERKHMDELPEGFTPLRIVFHIVNGKDLKYRRACRICKSPTEWDEKKGRYNFLCGKKSCHDKWVEEMTRVMGDKMGKYRPTETPEGLEKMLANRKISGKYIFSDGTEKTYTGSYERKALEFFDKVLECKSEDVISPGPVLKYNIDGKEHYYISDIYYAPYNLIIEVKDGGNNPNKNSNYSLTRKKQMAKEEYVIKNTNYNYLRLTDNDFSQLLAVFADLKLHLVENDSNRVIHVNENMGIPMPTMVGFGKNDIVIVNYSKNNVFNDPDESDYAIADSPKLDRIIARSKEGLLKEFKGSYLESCKYTPYIVRDVKDKIYPAINKAKDTFISDQFIFETVFGHKAFSKDQILFEPLAEQYNDYYNSLNQIQESIMNFINDKEE